MLFIITVPISFHTSLIFVILYKLCIDICNVLTSIEGDAIIFEGLNDILEEEYKAEEGEFKVFVVTIFLMNYDFNIGK